MNGAGYRIRTCVGIAPSAWKAVAIVLSAKPARSGTRRNVRAEHSSRTCPDLLRAAGATQGQTTTLSRRCFTAARSSASELLKSCTSRCAAPPAGVAEKTKSPVGLRTHRAWFSVFGVWPYGPPPLPGVCARFVSGWPKCKRASPRADIESMRAQTQYGRPHRPAMARGVALILRLVELMTR